MKLGDTLTIDGVHSLISNPDRRWWQFWKPRMVEGIDLARFIVTGTHVVPIRLWNGTGL